MGRAGPILSLLILAALSPGCAHYRLGDGPGPSFHTLYIVPATNKTVLAQARATTSAQVREAFEKDGRVTLVNSPQAADATLEVTLTNFHREVAANREDDTGLARKFTLFLSASCTLIDNRDGRLLFSQRVVTVQREAFVDNGLGDVPFGMSNDQQQSEYNTMPLLADALATRITHMVLDVW